MAPTQAALYDELAGDLHLSWSEAELPERERTKHVHRLHPYLGKFVPQLVEALLLRYVKPGGRVLDPFAGSGTTLVQCLESGYDAVGIDIAAFNCLLMRVKTSEYDPFRLESDVRSALARRGRSRKRAWRLRRRVVRAGCGRRAPPLSLAARGLRARRRPSRRARAGRAIRAADHALRPRLPARAAARAVLVPQAPSYLHARAGGGQVPAPLPRRHAGPAQDLPARACSRPRCRDRPRRRDRARARRLLRRDPHVAALSRAHRLPRAASLRVRDPRTGRSPRARARRRRRRERVAARSRATWSASRPSSDAAPNALVDGAPVLVVVNDRRNLYPEILERSGLRLVDRLERHVNRRTGRRAGEYFESILVCVRET